MEYTTVENLKYSSPNQQTIDMDVYFVALEESLPFTATPYDTEAHGVELYERAIAGDFGPITAYDGPAETEMLEQQMRQQRDALLSDVDVIVSNPLRWGSMSDTEQQSWADYRQALLDVPQQDTFPHEINWPDIQDANTSQPAA